MTKYFELNDKNVNHNLQKIGQVDLQNWKQYQMDSSTCTLTCIHNKQKSFNIKIPDITCAGLCFTLLILLPDLPTDHPRSNLFNSYKLIYNAD